MNIHGEPRVERTELQNSGAPQPPKEAAPQLIVSAALIEVSGIMAMVASMGNNDYEMSALQTILKDLKESKYTNPADAIRKAQDIMNNKLIR
jgi:hypothetical protein